MRNHPSAAALVSLALLLPVVLLAAVPAGAATQRVLTITTASAGPKVAFQAFDGNPLKTFDFDGDGDREIVAQNDNRYVYVLDSRTGALLAELLPKYPSSWGARPLNGPESAIMVHNGSARLVVANSAAFVTSWRFDGWSADGKRFNFTKEWERRLTDCHSNPGMDSKPVLADLDKDGDFEILAQTEEVGVYVLRHTGEVMWKACIGGGNGEPAVGDVNGDGWPDVVWASDGGKVTAHDGRTGSTRWSFWVGAPKYDLGSGSMPVGPAVAQLDGLGGDDVVVGVRDSSNCTDYSQNHAALFAISGKGQLLWMRQENTSNPLTYTHPMVVDADRDGAPEVYWADWNTQGHKCGNWELTGPANFYRYDAQGNLTWRQQHGTWWNNKDLALADVDGDGVQEVLVNGPNGGQDGIWYLDSRTGAKEAFVSTYPWKVTRGPVVADLWGNGTMQWVVPVYEHGSGTSGGAIQVFDTGQPYDAAWPHLPEPVLGSPGSPPPPPEPDPAPGGNGTFGALFTVRTAKEWWQDVKVQPDTPRAMASVKVRVHGGTWDFMNPSTWGSWTSSFHTPPGAKVEFLAQDAGGNRSQSLPFTWMDGNLTRRDTGPPPGFAAAFDPRSITNNWWVQVRVTSTGTVAKVEAQVDGAGWRDLPKQSWGDWAASFHVPDGAQVVFRATSAANETALSGAYTWG